MRDRDMSDIELVVRANTSKDPSFRRVNSTGCCVIDCKACRGAGLWRALNSLRGLRLV